MKTTTITIWRALQRGQCKQIAGSLEELWCALQSNHWYDPKQKPQWSITWCDEKVPLVNGKAHDWSAEGGCGGVHVHWNCPHCGEMHYTDETPEDTSPAVWFCENGKGIALVKWRKLKHRTTPRTLRRIPRRK